MDNKYSLSPFPFAPWFVQGGRIYHWIILSYPSRGTGIKTPAFRVKNQKKD